MSHSGRTFELNRNEKKHHQENYAYWQNKFGKYFEELYSLMSVRLWNFKNGGSSKVSHRKLTMKV